jgi:hypothetical protein
VRFSGALVVVVVAVALVTGAAPWFTDDAVYSQVDKATTTASHLTHIDLVESRNFSDLKY